MNIENRPFFIIFWYKAKYKYKIAWSFVAYVIYYYIK